MSKIAVSAAHPFDEAVTLVPVTATVHEHGRESTRHWQGQTHPAYANMVGPFGGITAAQALAAVLRHPGLLGEPVALTVNFAAALADAPFRVEARPVRTNRSTQHWTVELLQTGADGAPVVTTTATAVTAARRETWSMNDTPMPVVSAPADVPPMVGASGVEWLNRYEMRPVSGHIPQRWDGSGDHSQTQLWMRDHPPRPLDFCSLAAMSDIFFPRVWLRRARQVPAGTVSITVYFHAGAQQLAATGDGYLLGQARAQEFRNGFFDQTGQLWGTGGTLLATTHQIVYFKE